MQGLYLKTLNSIYKFEQELAEFTGAPYAVMTDCCTHAIELCFRLDIPKQISFTPYTYLSIPMLMHKLDIDYKYLEEKWTGEYRFHGTNVWDSARRLEKNMYESRQMQCLSFGWDKPLQIGRGGAILLDDKDSYQRLIEMRYDGRDLTKVPWQEQRVFRVGYHYRPTIEEAEAASEELKKIKITNPKPKYKQYPDLRTIEIVK